LIYALHNKFSEDKEFEKKQDEKLIILNNSSSKKSSHSNKTNGLTSRCKTLNCNGSGNTRKQFTSHSSSKYCPLNKAQHNLKKLNMHIKQEKKTYKDTLAYSDLRSLNYELQTKLRTLENEKHLGTVKFY